MGSGSLPAQGLATRLVAVEAMVWTTARSPAACGATIRPSSRGSQGQLLADPRTLLAGEEAILVEAFSRR